MDGIDRTVETDRADTTDNPHVSESGRIEVGRRKAIRRSGAVLIGSLLAGCSYGPVGSGSHDLDIRGRLQYEESRWTVNAQLERSTPNTFHDVQFLLFDDAGTQIYVEKVGQVPPEEHSQDITHVSVAVDTFPAIWTVTAEESPCDDARIEILYWIGSHDQRRTLPRNVTLWSRTERKCDEPIPPQRVIDLVGSTSD